MTLAWGEFWVVWAFLGMNILTPGPNVINTIATAMAAGRVAGLGSAAGVGLGLSLWCLGTSLGMSAVFVWFPTAPRMMGFVAIGLLGWFAVRYFRQAWAGWVGVRRGLPDPARAGVSKDSFWRAFARSLSVNATNPKALTTWLAILTLFPLARAGAGDVALLCLGSSLVGLGLHAVYACVFSTPVAAQFYLRAGWVISGGAGLFFALFAGKLIIGMLVT